MRHFRESMQNTMTLCQYSVRAFTHPEVDAIEEYDDQAPSPPTSSWRPCSSTPAIPQAPSANGPRN
ncbi:hypothetical protein ACFC0C_25165 [Streptomyces sp. NPDC056178]|uniref:hypothetical protein n=1 Tax=unclassified Streptomyces TaxID=2593676 RepID=UPI0035DF8110